MECELERDVDHSTIRHRFRETLIHCPLLERKGTGMSTLGVICGGCCLRIQQLLEAKAHLLLASVVNSEDFRRTPDTIQEHLPESLREYHVALGRMGKTIKDADDECSRCRPEPIGSKPVKAAQKTEMTQCGRGDLR